MDIEQKRIKQLRIEKELNQQDIADLLKISQVAYSKIERGKSKPNIEFIKILCRFYNVSADYILGLKDEI